MAIIKTSQRVGRYFVQSLTKENLYTETYRVEDENQDPFFSEGLYNENNAGKNDKSRNWRCN